MDSYLYIIADQHGLRFVGAAPNVEARLRGLQDDVGIPLHIEWKSKPMDVEQAMRVVRKAHVLLEPMWTDGGWYRCSTKEARAAIKQAQAPETPVVEDDYEPGTVFHPDDDASD